MHRFEKYSTKSLFRRRQWYWRFRHENSNLMADGSEGYTTSSERDQSLSSFINIVREGDFGIVDMDNIPGYPGSKQ